MSPVSREYSSLAKAGAEAATVANAAALVEAVAFARNALLSEEGGARASDVAIIVISAIVESFIVDVRFISETVGIMKCSSTCAIGQGALQPTD
mmetsp:Transcript_9366/g.14011  ORF Transcript_9366/g.14011 Transcript_9366/m.14011 type:complete len:94 (+) Transcript_9366:353-634(+)